MHEADLCGEGTEWNGHRCVLSRRLLTDDRGRDLGICEQKSLFGFFPLHCETKPVTADLLAHYCHNLGVLDGRCVAPDTEGAVVIKREAVSQEVVELKGCAHFPCPAGYKLKNGAGVLRDEERSQNNCCVSNSCVDHTCPYGYVRKDGAERITTLSDEACCRQVTCSDAYTDDSCPANYSLLIEKDTIVSDVPGSYPLLSECCGPDTCRAFVCGVGMTLRGIPLDPGRPPSDDNCCIGTSCDSFDCPLGKVRNTEASEGTRSEAHCCRAKKCHDYTCPVGYTSDPDLVGVGLPLGEPERPEDCCLPPVQDTGCPYVVYNTPGCVEDPETLTTTSSHLATKHRCCINKGTVTISGTNMQFRQMYGGFSKSFTYDERGGWKNLSNTDRIELPRRTCMALRIEMEGSGDVKRTMEPEESPYGGNGTELNTDSEQLVCAGDTEVDVERVAPFTLYGRSFKGVRWKLGKIIENTIDLFEPGNEHVPTNGCDVNAYNHCTNGFNLWKTHA